MIVTTEEGIRSLDKYLTYAVAGRLGSLAHHRGTTLLANYQYCYDLSGNRLQAVEDVRQLVLATGSSTPSGWTPPAQFTAEEAGYLSVALAWPDSAIEEEGYTLERSTDGQNWIAVAELSANTQRYIDYGLSRNTRYWYRLTAHNSQGSSDPQSELLFRACRPRPRLSRYALARTGFVPEGLLLA